MKIITETMSLIDLKQWDSLKMKVNMIDVFNILCDKQQVTDVRTKIIATRHITGFLGKDKVIKETIFSSNNIVLMSYVYNKLIKADSLEEEQTLKIIDLVEAYKMEVSPEEEKEDFQKIIEQYKNWRIKNNV